MAVAFGSAGAEASNTASYPMPAGVNLGDTLVAFVENDGGGTPARTGWSIPSFASMTTNGSNLFVGLVKIADAGDVSLSASAGSAAFTGTSGFADGVILCYPGGDTTTPVNVAGHNTANSNVSPSLTTTAPNCIEIACLNSDGGIGSTAAAPSWTRRVDGTSNNFWVGERAAATAGATTAASIVAGGVSSYGVVSIVLNSVLSAAVPDAPIAPIVTAQHAGAGFQLATAPANNGAIITGYIWETAPSPYTSWSTVSGVTTQAGGFATGLTPGTSYKVRATATNSVGNSTAGTASAAVTALNLAGILVDESGRALLTEGGNAVKTEAF